jgi:hypothetical protein
MLPLGGFKFDQHGSKRLLMLFMIIFLPIPFALQISAHPLPRPPGEGWGEGIKKTKI